VYSTRVYSTRLHVYTRASLTDILARKSARVGQVGGLVGEDRRACPARGKLNAPRHADFRARILAGQSTRMSVSVSVPWNLSFSVRKKNRVAERQTDRQSPDRCFTLPAIHKTSVEEILRTLPALMTCCVYVSIFVFARFIFADYSVVQVAHSVCCVCCVCVCVCMCVHTIEPK